jgi:hypothetical protein
VRIIAACALGFFATSAVAENLVLNDPIIHYGYTFETRGSLHFCDFSTAMVKPPLPLFIKLTAAFITDDKKPRDHDTTVMYIVEAAADVKPSLETKDIKVLAGRIISDIFHSDLMATKNTDKDLGASYTISSEGPLALFMSTIRLGKYSLAVDFENNASLIVNVKPTPDIFEPSEKWNKCSIAIMQHQQPK